MFKFINLVLAAVSIYFLIGAGDSMDAAVEAQNVAATIDNGVQIIAHTLWLTGIYIVVFGGTELYVTTESIEQEEENS